MVQLHLQTRENSTGPRCISSNARRLVQVLEVFRSPAVRVRNRYSRHRKAVWRPGRSHLTIGPQCRCSRSMLAGLTQVRALFSTATDLDLLAGQLRVRRAFPDWHTRAAFNTRQHEGRPSLAAVFACLRTTPRDLPGLRLNLALLSSAGIGTAPACRHRTCRRSATRAGRPITTRRTKVLGLGRRRFCV
jgi:hypothetical protein